MGAPVLVSVSLRPANLAAEACSVLLVPSRPLRGPQYGVMTDAIDLYLPAGVTTAPVQLISTEDPDYITDGEWCWIAYEQIGATENMWGLLVPQMPASAQPYAYSLLPRVDPGPYVEGRRLPDLSARFVAVYYRNGPPGGFVPEDESDHWIDTTSPDWNLYRREDVED